MKYKMIGGLDCSFTCDLCGKQITAKSEQFIKKLYKLHMKLQHNIIEDTKNLEVDFGKNNISNINEYKHFISNFR